MARFRSPFLARNPIFQNFLAASTISLIGSCLFDIAMPLYVWSRTHSAVALSMVNVGIHLPYFLMAPLTGYTVDRFDKRKVMLISDMGQILTMIFLLAYDMSSLEPVWPIILAVFVAKTLMITFETVTTFQLVPALVNPDDLSMANTWFLSSLRVIQVVGPVTAGLLITTFGVRSCIALNILSFGATLYFVYSMKNLTQLIEGNEDGPREAISIKAMTENFKESVRYVWQSPLFKSFILLMFFWNLSSLLPNTPSVIYYFTAEHNFTPAQYGLVVSLLGIFGICGYFLAGPIYERTDFRTTFVRSCIWQAALGTLCTAFLHRPIVFAVLFAMARMGSSILNMGTFLLRQTRIPKSRMGGINSCLRMFFMSAAPVSALIQGVLIQEVGIALPLGLGAICLWGTVWYAREVGANFQPKTASKRFDEAA